MFIGGLCDIRILCSNNRIETLRASYYMEFKNQDLKTQRWSNEENTKVVRQLMKAHRRAHESIKMFIGGSCDIGILCSTIRIVA